MYFRSVAGWLGVIITCLAVFIFLTGLQAGAGVGGPALVIPSARHDAGQVWQGETVSHTFAVRNEGEAELRILQVKPG